MRKLISNLMLSVAVVISAASFRAPAVAEDVKMVGVITKIKLAADGKSAVAILKDNKSGDSVTININARDAESFRQSRTQIAADIARAVSLGRRGM